jgi:small subunit ribosomal protein S1
LAGRGDRGGPPADNVAVGDEFDFKIIKLNEADKKIGLSRRAVADQADRTRVEEYQRQAAAAALTREDMMNVRGGGES